jgi:hypothetical protein
VERELQTVKLSAIRCNCIAILCVSLVNFAALTLCVASEQVFIVVAVYLVMTQSGNFWIHPRTQTTVLLLLHRINWSHILTKPSRTADKGVVIRLGC